MNPTSNATHRVKKHSKPAALAPLVCVFRVGPHALTISRVMEGRWRFSLDGAEVPNTFPTQAEAWEAGVRAAYALDASPA